MRYFLLDRVTELVVGTRARGIKCVTLTEQILHDHFPEHPIFPGVLVVEAAAQLGGFLLEISRADGSAAPRRAVLGQIAKAKFHRPARPGDTLELTATIGPALDTAARVDVAADIAGERAMRGTLTFMLMPVASERVHAERRALYALWTRDLDLGGVALP